MAVFQIAEYGRIRSDAGTRRIGENEIIIPEKSFDNLWNFILEHQVSDSVSEKAFEIYTRRGERVIKAKNYVGVIETKNKDVIEVLPKIYGVGSLLESKRIFLKMLGVLKNFRNLSFQDAALDAEADFPILEIFISNYVKEAERLFLNGIKKGYAPKSYNKPFLKGKLLFSKHFKTNIATKSNFFIKYSEYNENIALNRIIKSTLFKLLRLTKMAATRQKIARMLGLLHKLPFAKNIPLDLANCTRGGRLFVEYRKLIAWSEVFLLDKGFTNFSGKEINQALLFPMESVFESFIGHVVKKYAADYYVSLQHQQFHLVEKYKDKPRFKLKPDLFAKNKKNTSSIVIDTKWKIIGEGRKKKFVKETDMYQLYAYGRKYLKGYKEPILYLIYPKNEAFEQPLPPFYYEKEGDFWLKLYAIPFNLLGNYKNQVITMLNSFNAEQEENDLELP